MDDDEFRTAAHWWLRLKECGSDARILREFTHWLTQSAAHRRAFAQVEALSLNVELALSEYPSPEPSSETSALRAVAERAK